MDRNIDSNLIHLNQETSYLHISAVLHIYFEAIDRPVVGPGWID